MNDSIRIRYAKRDDLYNISVFLNDCWRAEYSQIVAADYLDAMTVEERQGHLLKRYDEGESKYMMMLDDERLIGAVVFGKSFTEGYTVDGEVSAIYLQHDYIGKGHGHRLFVKTEQALAAMGYTHFVLDLLAENTRALRFYLAHGYQKVADCSIKLGEKDYSLVVMRKENPLAIRQETPADHAAVYSLTKTAFADMEHSDGTEQDLVERLRKSTSFIPELSLVAERDGHIIGHILFTKVTIGEHPALVLAPVSVLPEYHRTGIGSALINRGHEIARSMGYKLCVLIGHKDYYPRFGYEIASHYGITFPFDAPDDCSMVKFLDESGKTIKGKAVFVPEFFKKA